MRNPTTIRLSEKCRIALLLFAAMLAVVILVFPSTVEVSAEGIEGSVDAGVDQPVAEVAAENTNVIIPNGIYQITNTYVASNYSPYGTFYLRGESGAVELSTLAYSNFAHNFCNYWYFLNMGGGQYRIHSFADYTKALSAVNGDAVLTSASPSVATLWTLQESNYGGYQLVCASSTSNDLLSVITQPSIHTDQSPMYYTLDVNVGEIANMSFDSWNITRANIDDLYFQEIATGNLYRTFDKTYPISDSSKSLTSMGYTVKKLGYNGGLYTPSSITWESYDTDKVTVSTNGTISFVSGGETGITASVEIDELIYSAQYTVSVVAYTATVNNYYDAGYRFRNGESSSASSSNINYYAAQVANRYLQLFGLQITLNNASEYTSLADTCFNTKESKIIITETNTCNHFGGLHTKRENLISAFEYQHSGTSTVTNVLWSGHRIVSVDDDDINPNTNTDYNRSCWVPSSKIICMLTISASPSGRYNSATSTLMHELAHSLGAPDHYHEETLRFLCRTWGKREL